MNRQQLIDSLVESLVNELYLKTTGFVTAVEVFPAGRDEHGNEYGPWVFDVVVLDYDGRTIAYRSNNDSQNSDWELGSVEDVIECVLATREAVAEEERHEEEMAALIRRIEDQESQ